MLHKRYYYLIFISSRSQKTLAQWMGSETLKKFPIPLCSFHSCWGEISTLLPKLYLLFPAWVKLKAVGRKPRKEEGVRECWFVRVYCILTQHESQGTYFLPISITSCSLSSLPKSLNVSRPCILFIFTFSSLCFHWAHLPTSCSLHGSHHAHLEKTLRSVLLVTGK